jgi:hypothetical protein
MFLLFYRLASVTCFGFVDPRADLPVDWLESKVAMPSLDAAVDRAHRKRRTRSSPQMPTSDANLIAGMKIYKENCASCRAVMAISSVPMGCLQTPFILGHLNSSKMRRTCPKTRTSTSSSTAYASAE